MLEKKSKISVLRRMIGLEEDMEPQFIVPQNSLTNFKQKLGLCEPITPTIAQCTSNNFQQQSQLVKHLQQQHELQRQLQQQHMTKQQIEEQTLLQNKIQKQYQLNNKNEKTSASKCLVAKCPHCESMAKNFLYLETLIRSNFNTRYNCNLCYSTLKYLQYVNKSIFEVFGNFDTAPNGNTSNVKQIQSKQQLQTQQKQQQNYGRGTKAANRLPKKPSRIPKLASKVSKITSITKIGEKLVKTGVLDKKKLPAKVMKSLLKYQPKKNKHSFSRLSVTGGKRYSRSQFKGLNKSKSRTNRGSNVIMNTTVAGGLGRNQAKINKKLKSLPVRQLKRKVMLRLSKNKN